MMLTVSGDDRRLYFAAFSVELAENVALIILSLFVLKVVAKYTALHVNLRVSIIMRVKGKY